MEGGCSGTSRNPISCIPGEFGGNGGAAVLALGSFPTVSSLRHRHLDSEARQVYLGRHIALWGVGFACEHIKE